jgi:hypothetical protein
MKRRKKEMEEQNEQAMSYYDAIDFNTTDKEYEMKKTQWNLSVDKGSEINFAGIVKELEDEKALYGIISCKQSKNVIIWINRDMANKAYIPSDVKYYFWWRDVDFNRQTERWTYETEYHYHDKLNTHQAFCAIIELEKVDKVDKVIEVTKSFVNDFVTKQDVTLKINVTGYRQE